MSETHTRRNVASVNGMRLDISFGQMRVYVEPVLA
jgi:hypothetical protein